MFTRTHIQRFERGLVFHQGDYVETLGPGTTWRFDVLGRYQIERLDMRQPFVNVADLSTLVAIGAFDPHETLTLDLKADQRAIVWVDGRVYAVLPPGLYVLWTVLQTVDVQVVSTGTVRLRHAQLHAILAEESAPLCLAEHTVPAHHVGLVFEDGEHTETLGPGTYAFWRQAARVRVENVDLRERMLDVNGQDIMTADKVTLRLNAVVSFVVDDPLASVTRVPDAGQALYRAAQLALRATVGTRELDVLLTEKDAVRAELEDLVRAEATALGLSVRHLGIRDVILPGDMKELMNRVTEAKKAAEASLVTRREETAAMRSQANTARILEKSPTLMRLRELEVLEKVADKANLTVVLGDGGLSDKVVKLL